MIDLDKLLELEAKATPGPWTFANDNDCWRVRGKDYAICKVTLSFLDPPTDEPDANFISTLRNSIKELCTELKAAREVVEFLRDWNNGHADSCDQNPCDCAYDDTIRMLKKYDEARRG